MVVQIRQTALEEDLHGLRQRELLRDHQRIASRSLQGPSAEAPSPEPALGERGAHVLGQEERVALRVAEDVVQDRPVGLGTAQHLARDELGRVAVEPLHLEGAARDRAQRSELLGSHLVRPVRAHDGEGQCPEELGPERLEERERQLVGPLQVVEEQQERALKRQGAEQVPSLREDLLASALGGERRPVDHEPDHLAQGGVVVGDERLCGPEQEHHFRGPAVPAAIGGELEQRSQRMQGARRGIAALASLGLHRHAPPADDRHAQRPGEPHRLGQQPGLADATLSREAHERARSARRLGQVRLQLAQEAGATDERACVEVGPGADLGGLREPVGAQQGEPVDDVERIAGARAPILREQRTDHGVELGRDLRRELRRGYGLRGEVRTHDLLRAAHEGGATRESLVEQAAEGVEVRPGVELLAADLLGGEVRQRAQPHRGLVDPPAALLVGDRREPEVDEHRVGVADDDVVGAQVAVDQPSPVKVRKRLADTTQDREKRSVDGAWPRRGPAPEDLVEPVAVNELHDKPGHARLDALVHDVDHPRVSHAAQDADLVAERKDRAGRTGLHRLERDVALARARGSIHGPGAAASHALLEHVARDGGGRSRGGLRVRVHGADSLGRRGP